MENKELQDKIQLLEKSLADAQASNVVVTRELEAVKKELVDANAQIEAAQKVAHDSLVKEVFDLRKQLCKPDVKALADAEKVKAYVETLSKRTDQSLRDSLEDLRIEVAAVPVVDTAAQAADPVLNAAGEQPGTGETGKKPAKPLSNKDKAKALFSKK